ncbi:hypothetical protein IQ07DRAFT_537378 [Pyrenochaeta sp. DS3sAY3a]|nr:hypothetical protein IQ07DRAFT_537378 [Pyrenochaeta sp. DS3sAY3a]
MPSIEPGRTASPSKDVGTRAEERQAYNQEGDNQDEFSPSGVQVHSLSGSQNHEVPSFDLTGQLAPQGTKPGITASLWEDEGCLLFKVYINDICVARREDNHMINGSQLLAVAGMTRGQRDEFLETEKVRHVVTIAPIYYLIGTWIPFERALELANKERITERLYPLFVYDIGALLYHPSNQPGAEARLSAGGVKCATTHSSQQVATQERIVSSARESSIDPQNDTLLFEVGPIGSLFNSLLELLGLILIDIRTQPDISEHHQSLESSCAAFLFWGTDHGVSQGDLDEALQDSAQLRDTCLMALTSIGQFLTSSFSPLLSDKRQLDEIVNSTGIQKPLEQAMSILEHQHDHAYRPDQDKRTLCQTLRMKIDTLIMLDSSLASPAAEHFDNEEPRAIEYPEKHMPEQAYINSVAEKFPLAASTMVTHLGKLNWERYNHMIRLQRNAIQQEIETTVKDKAKTIFHDSGLGNSLAAQSEPGAANRSESVYAPSVASTRAEASHRRLPPLPPQARSGQPFTCEICNKQVQYQRTKPWKKHIFNDILAYACFYEECSLANVFLEDPEALMSHLEKHHELDVSISKVACPLCANYTSCDRGALLLHFARHMEEIALAILPSGVDSDDEPDTDTPVDTDSEDQEVEPFIVIEPNPYHRFLYHHSPQRPVPGPGTEELASNAEVDPPRRGLPSFHKLLSSTRNTDGMSPPILEPNPYVQDEPLSGTLPSTLDRFPYSYTQIDALSRVKSSINGQIPQPKTHGSASPPTLKPNPYARADASDDAQPLRPFPPHPGPSISPRGANSRKSNLMSLLNDDEPENEARRKNLTVEEPPSRNPGRLVEPWEERCSRSPELIPVEVADIVPHDLHKPAPVQTSRPSLNVTGRTTTSSDPWRGRHSNDWLFNDYSSVTARAKNLFRRRKSK